MQLSPLRHRRLAKPRLPTLTGKTYRLEYTDDLTSNQWHPLTDPSPAMATPSSSKTPPPPPARNAFTGSSLCRNVARAFQPVIQPSLTKLSCLWPLRHRLESLCYSLLRRSFLWRVVTGCGVE